MLLVISLVQYLRFDMRWNNPKIGDVKVVTKFLWLPLEINFETRWLEDATIKYVYVTGHVDSYKYWQPIEFVDKEEN